MLVMELGRRVQINHLAFSPDGQQLVGSGDFGLAIWRAVADGQRAQWFRGSSYAGAPHFTPDGRWLFAGLGRYDPATRERSGTIEWDRQSGMQFDVSPTEPLLLVTQYAVPTTHPTNRVTLWKADDLTPAGKVWEREFTDHPYWNWAQFLPGGNRFVRVILEWSFGSSARDFYLRTYDTATGGDVGEPTRISHGGLISRDGRWLVNRNSNSIDLHPLDPAAGSPARLCNDSRKHFTDIAFHPSGRHLAAASNDETVKVFDTATGREARAFTWKLGKMRSIAFSPDGTLAAAGSDKGKVIVWDVDL